MIFYPIQGSYPSSAFGTATPNHVSNGKQRIGSHVCLIMDHVDGVFSLGFLNFNPKILRVVRIQTILLLKSMSERVGSDIQRLWNEKMNSYIDPKSIEYSNSDSEFQSRSMSDSDLSDVEFENNMA